MRKNRTKRNNKLIGRELDIIEKTITSVVMTFDEALELFIDDAKRKGLREFTVVYYRRECNDFRKWLAKIDHSLLIGEVVRDHINDYVEDMQQERELKPGTINAKLRAVRTFFHYLYGDAKIIAENPMYKYPLLKERKGNIETFTMKQLQALLNAPDRRTFTGQRDYTYMLLLLETGIRLNESAGILLEDAKLSEGVIFIRNTKNHFHRYVPIQSKMKDQLRRYIKLRGICETEYLFVTLEEKAMTRSTLQKIVSHYGKLAGIKGVRLSPHTFRHTFAKLSVMNGAGVFELQKILGHSTMDMVRTYVNLYSNEVSEKHREFSPLNNLDI
ncbi:tyrosine-type recombinase/integrase [Evansella halocellulosilytica]|uniref:tyrosine-type recombinase/integrase n=1 Tax=Evansella halocellulosilytica TaxID=2011013 RepID=UPI000BB8330F|nr:tyrosine-type recombinase/integrase [Evansella halocellulosilytica]